MRPDTEVVADFVGGFVAGEGCFSSSRSGDRYVFEVGLGAADRHMCESLHEFFGVGRLYDSPRRKEHYDAECQYQVKALAELLNVVVPFMDAHLPPSHKREQYLAWKERRLDYWEHKAKRIRPCTVEGCEEPRRAHGLCRRHLYQRYRV